MTTPTGRFEVRSAGSSDDWTQVPANVYDQASVALAANPPSNLWDVRKVCLEDESIAASGTVTVNPATIASWGSFTGTCPTP